MTFLPPPPPPFDQLPAGTKLVAGLGTATVLPDIDFETYSEAGYVWDEARCKWRGPPGAPKGQKGLGVVGARNYAAHPSTEVLCVYYDLKDGRGRRGWRPGLPDPVDLFEYLATGGPIEAWNVGFERWVWNLLCVPRMGWPRVAPGQWRCAMAKARASGYPGGLGNAGAILGLKNVKDADGKRLLKKFSMPRDPTATDPRRRVLPLWESGEIEPRGIVAYHAALQAGKTERVAQTAARRATEAATEDYLDALRLLRYNEIDILSEAEASSLVPDLDGEELQWWQADQAINVRGVHMDRAGVDNCIAVIEQAHGRYNLELQRLTGIDSASKIEQLQGWLRANGLFLDSLDEEGVATALALPSLLPHVRRVLEIRAAIGSASVKKVFAMRNALSAFDRLHDLFLYHAARTGRATGDGPQPTNLPKAGPDLARCGEWAKGKLVEGTGCGRHYVPGRWRCPWCSRLTIPGAPAHEWSPSAAEDALEALQARSLDWLEYLFGDAMSAVAGVLRALFMAAPDHDLISTDYNSIEAVGLAMMAGEQWRIEVFRTHGKIYEKSASMMYRVPFEDFASHRAETGQHHPLRQKGKIGELAFGYQGWLGAAKAFDMPGEDDEIKNDILAWRRASPSIEWLWGGQTVGKSSGIRENAGDPTFASRWDRTPYFFGVEGMAVRAVSEPGQGFDVARLDGTFSGISFVCRGDALFCRLPSARVLTYHRPRLGQNDRGELALSYEGWNTNPKNGPKGWVRMDTWGGRLVENINQATCRDILRFACIALEQRGYPVVLHVYDEIVSEIPEGFGSLEEFETIVTTLPKWAADWPIRAPGGYRAKRYRKG